MPIVAEVLRPADVSIKLYRGTDNTLIFTVLNANGSPRDMSGYAGEVPQIRFSNASAQAGGTTPGFAPQAQTNAGLFGLSMCEWLAGGVGGQIHVVVPEVNLTAAVRGSKKGGYNDTNQPVGPFSGRFDIQIRGILNLTTIGGANASYFSVQRAVTGTWTLDDDVTNLPAESPAWPGVEA